MKKTNGNAQLSQPEQTILNQAEVIQPKYFCATCTNCEDNRYCKYYNRHIEADYNRCYNHSNYEPIQADFKQREQNDEIELKKEIKRYA